MIRGEAAGELVDGEGGELLLILVNLFLVLPEQIGLLVPHRAAGDRGGQRPRMDRHQRGVVADVANLVGMRVDDRLHVSRRVLAGGAFEIGELDHRHLRRGGAH